MPLGQMTDRLDRVRVHSGVDEPIQGPILPVDAQRRILCIDSVTGHFDDPL